jgi:hypothetical protein
MADIHHCERCGDDGSIYLHARCHPSSATWAVLTGDVLTIECAKCQKPVVRFKVELLRDEPQNLGG